MLVPNIIVDDFFTYPNKVRELALSLPYYKDTKHRWPGLRTDPLYEIHPTFFYKTLNKVFSLTQDIDSDSPNYTCSLFFQKTNASFKGGWIHIDGNDTVAAFIVYLSPNADINEGTSLYTVKDPLSFDTHLHLDKRAESFKNPSLVSDIEKYRIEANNQFKETMFVGNVYNRLFMFDANNYHGVKDFVSSSSDPRLTLIGFIHGINAKHSPIRRVRNIHL